LTNTSDLGSTIKMNIGLHDRRPAPGISFQALRGPALDEWNPRVVKPDHRRTVPFTSSRVEREGDLPLCGGSMANPHFDSRRHNPHLLTGKHGNGYRAIPFPSPPELGGDK
jgi:hypothetical protein